MDFKFLNIRMGSLLNKNNIKENKEIPLSEESLFFSSILIIDDSTIMENISEP